MNSTRAFRLRTQQIQVTLLVSLVFVSGFFLGNRFALTAAAQDNLSQPPDAREAFEPFWQVYNHIQSNYLDPVEQVALVDGAITGMMDALEDQYSGYMDPEVFPLLSDDLDGSIDGIGVVINTNEETGETAVVSILAGTPAMEAGILPGDVFIAVDGEEVITFSQLELAAAVRGEAGSQLEITMRRDEQLIDFTLSRARIDVPNVESRIINDSIGYVKLNQFSSEARAELDTAFTELDVNSLDGLVIDFRGNPGGYLNSAIDVASAFIEDGVVVVEQFGDGNEQVFNATGNDADINVPIVVLVDEGSASASELVAGALQDLDIATIMGETTVGKGTVQTWQELVNGGGVRLTIARWLTPERHWIHEQGITPDIVIEWTPETLEELTEPDADIQLSAAVDYLQSLVQEAQPEQS